MTKKVREHIGFHYLLKKNVYFDSFGIENIPQEVFNKFRDKSITCNIFRIQDNESIMCGFYLYRFHRIYACRKNLVRLY